VQASVTIRFCPTSSKGSSDSDYRYDTREEYTRTVQAVKDSKFRRLVVKRVEKAEPVACKGLGKPSRDRRKDQEYIAALLASLV
jgi:hypothetical protein